MFEVVSVCVFACECVSLTPSLIRSVIGVYNPRGSVLPLLTLSRACVFVVSAFSVAGSSHAALGTFLPYTGPQHGCWRFHLPRLPRTPG